MKNNFHKKENNSMQWLYQATKFFFVVNEKITLVLLQVIWLDNKIYE